MQTHATGTRLPEWPRTVTAQSREFLPAESAVVRLKQGRVLDAREHRVGVAQGRLEVPDPGELPRVRRAVVPLVRSGHAVVLELVPDGIPRRAAVIGTLDQLSEPARRLRRVQTVRIDGRTLEVIDLPSAPEGPGDLPVLSLAVGRQNERALFGTDQHSYATHTLPPLSLRARPDFGPRVVRRRTLVTISLSVASPTAPRWLLAVDRQSGDRQLLGAGDRSRRGWT